MAETRTTDHRLVRNVSSPLTADMLRPLDPHCRTVQFGRALTTGDYRVLADWLVRYPSVSLRAYGSYDGSIRDLEFLRFFPNLYKFSADALYHCLESIEGLGYLPAAATTIGLGRTKRRLSLKPLGRFASLHRLQLEGHPKDIETISGLRSLRSVTLRSITLPDLSVLQPLTQLRALDLKLGGIRDFALLPAIGQLDYLELWMVRGLQDLSPVAEMEHLSHLFLRSQKQITQLPDFTHLSRLETIWLETMAGLTELVPESWTG